MPIALPLPTPQTRGILRDPVYRRSWTAGELVNALAPTPARALDLGAGRHPLRLRDCDDVVSADFDSSASPTVVADFTSGWPFGEELFDLIYLSHVVEHLYPSDRDRMIMNVYRSMRPGGFVLIRVPHRSSVQATGWEHQSVYGLNGATSLCHGFNPKLPMFRAATVGVAFSTNFERERQSWERYAERLMHRSFRLTDQLLSKVVGGIAEVQFLLQRLPAADEARLRTDLTTGTAN